MPRSDEARLGDIRDSCRRIQSFVEGMEFASFAADEKTVRAVLFELVVIGEAAKSLSESARSRAPELPWRRIAAMRDFVVHQYHGIMLDLIWETITKRVPELLAAIEP